MMQFLSEQANYWFSSSDQPLSDDDDDPYNYYKKEEYLIQPSVQSTLPTPSHHNENDDNNVHINVSFEDRKDAKSEKSHLIQTHSQADADKPSAAASSAEEHRSSSVSSTNNSASNAAFTSSVDLRGNGYSTFTSAPRNTSYSYAFTPKSSEQIRTGVKTAADQSTADDNKTRNNYKFRLGSASPTKTTSTDTTSRTDSRVNVPSTKHVVAPKKDDTDDDEDTTWCCCCSDKPCCCNKKCLKDYRFITLLSIILLACLGGPLYLLVRLAHFEFDYHKECVICFKDKTDFEVIFNQTSGECEFYQQQELYDSNDIVLDPNFCGAPHCQNQELLPGLRLVPYWVVFFSSVFSIILSTGFNIIKYNCYFPMKKRFTKWKWGEEIHEENPLIRLVELANDLKIESSRPKLKSALLDLRHLNTFLKTIGLTDPYFFGLLLLFAVGHYSFTIYEVVTKPNFAHLDGWHKYQTIYGLFLNSGSIEVLLYWLTMAPMAGHVGLQRSEEVIASVKTLKDSQGALIVDHRLMARFTVFVKRLPVCIMDPFASLTPTTSTSTGLTELVLNVLFVAISVLTVLPIVFSHIIPGIFLFIPYWSWIVLVFFAMIGLAVFFRSRAEENFALYWFSVVMIRLLGSFLVLFLFQMLFNWSALFYEGRTWSDIMTGEFRLRNTDCYFNAIVNSIQIYNVGFAGLIFS